MWRLRFGRGVWSWGVFCRVLGPEPEGLLAMHQRPRGWRRALHGPTPGRTGARGWQQRVHMGVQRRIVSGSGQWGLLAVHRVQRDNVPPRARGVGV